MYYMVRFVSVVCVHILYCDCGTQEEKFVKHWSRTWTVTLMSNALVLR